MLYTLLALVVVIIALAIAYRAIKVLWLSSWFMGWLRGMLGLGLLTLASAIAIIAYDIYSYQQIMVGQPVATINFEAIEDQYFDAVIVDANGKQQRLGLHGDQWQLDARVIKWQGYLASFGIKPAYRLDKLSGRYYDIQKETSAKRSAYAIVSSPLQLDLWRFINEHPQWFPIVDANYGTAKYLPMKAGALYEISLSASGLNVRPLNDVANQAVAEWK